MHNPLRKNFAQRACASASAVREHNDESLADETLRETSEILGMDIPSKPADGNQPAKSDDAEGGASSSPFIPVADLRKRELYAAAAQGESREEFLQAMREGKDPFALSLADQINCMIADAIISRRVSIKLGFELVENLDFEEVDEQGGLLRFGHRLLIHDKALSMFAPEGEGRNFKGKAEHVAYFDAVTTYLIDSLSKQGYVCSWRDVIPNIPPGVKNHQSPRWTFQTADDLPDEFWDINPYPVIHYGKTQDVCVTWGDEDFADALPRFDSDWHVTALEHNIPLGDIMAGGRSV